ncbi:Clavaminate synthase-like protein [Hymenopellis radicata]|nr:Clavaminate synthase-like protein [Hymenopellis radicata]
MTIELVALPSSSVGLDPLFGREVRGFNPASFEAGDFEQIRTALYTHNLLLFRNVTLTPEQQYALNKSFDPDSENFGHGNNAIDKNKKSILHPDLKTIPRVPQVQLIGNGTIHNHEGLPTVTLKHPSHTTFHKTRNDTPGATRFFRWHIDAALYNLAPPKVTTLYAVTVCVYDDGTSDELSVSLGTTAFVSGKTMFDILPPDLKNLAVRTKARCAPHPYTWMAAARAVPTGLGLESDDLELPLDALPPWEEAKIQTLPLLWKNEVTGELHFQVHPCGVAELFVEPSPGALLYAEGAHIKDLKEVRRLLYTMQRPGIAPHLVYAHDWTENDLVLFHNRGVLHSVVGTFAPDQIRAFHQCNLAASDFPAGPTDDDVKKWSGVQSS